MIWTLTAHCTQRQMIETDIAQCPHPPLTFEHATGQFFDLPPPLQFITPLSRHGYLNTITYIPEKWRRTFFCSIPAVSGRHLVEECSAPRPYLKNRPHGWTNSVEKAHQYYITSVKRESLYKHSVHLPRPHPHFEQILPRSVLYIQSSWVALSLPLSMTVLPDLIMMTFSRPSHEVQWWPFRDKIMTPSPSLCHPG